MMKKKILAGIIIVFALIQFKTVDKTNPETDSAQDFLAVNNASIEMENLFKNACYDCHSNVTRYPWYFSVAPISWWTRGHIDHARGNLNFSIWQTYQQKKQDYKLEESIEIINKKWMPPKTYKMMHAEARLSDEEREKMVSWMKSINNNTTGNNE
ncbi:MAG: heme-binding domain-containing protein [Bacteroidia bacterium]|nr:heme-binding domain-containing protein [Bacteroidia bacterium]NNM15382.1 heme-binding domain-containing protein [Bacteroidia bacterium]